MQFKRSKIKSIHCVWMTVLLTMLTSFSVIAETRVAILEFELKDLTLRPRTPQELDRTASIKPLLQKTLEEDSSYSIVNVDAGAQKEADAGFGYLFDNHDIAAELGKKVGADYVVVGRVHKPSFLFAYLLMHLIDVNTDKLVGDYVVEVKGPQEKITRKGVESLARKIHNTINSR